MAERTKIRPLVPGVTGATTRAAWTPVARAHRGELVRSLRPSLKHLIVPPISASGPVGASSARPTGSSTTSFGRSATSFRSWYRRRVASHAS
jgi:hypothetical protein